MLQYHFEDEIFRPFKCIHGPGEDPFEAVMCAVGAASQISYLLIEDSIFNTKYHLDLCRISKIVLMALIHTITIGYYICPLCYDF